MATFIRQAGAYALVRPGSERRFSSVPAADGYKAGNFIETFVYRGAMRPGAGRKPLPT